jgi:hypothetical protein
LKPNSSQVAGAEQNPGETASFVKWGKPRFTFSFHVLLPFAAIHHNLHDTGMTPRRASMNTAV